MIELSELKKIRRKLGLTQTQFAAHVGVSQSMIAKIEYGKLDPSYTRAKKIFEAVERLLHRESFKAKDMMVSPIISVKPEEKVESVVRTMKSNEISQLPIVKNGIVIGLITECDILNKLSEGKFDPKSEVSKIAGSAPPIVASDTIADAVYLLLKYSQIVVVADKGKIKGLITKADAMTKILNW